MCRSVHAESDAVADEDLRLAVAEGPVSRFAQGREPRLLLAQPFVQQHRQRPEAERHADDPLRVGSIPSVEDDLAGVPKVAARLDPLQVALLRVAHASSVWGPAGPDAPHQLLERSL